jgi:hypothetical protein
MMYSVPGDSKDQQVIELGFCQEDFILIVLLAGGDYLVCKPDNCMVTYLS